MTDENPSLSQDTFFYSLVYDPTQKTLLADKGEIRVGPRFQADVPEMLQEGRSCSLNPDHCIIFSLLLPDTVTLGVFGTRFLS